MYHPLLPFLPTWPSRSLILSMPTRPVSSLSSPTPTMSYSNPEYTSSLMTGEFTNSLGKKTFITDSGGFQVFCGHIGSSSSYWSWGEQGKEENQDGVLGMEGEGHDGGYSGRDHHLDAQCGGVLTVFGGFLGGELCGWFFEGEWIGVKGIWRSGEVNGHARSVYLFLQSYIPKYIGGIEWINIPIFIAKYKHLHNKCPRNVKGCNDCQFTDLVLIKIFLFTNCHNPWNSVVRGREKGRKDINLRTVNFNYCMEESDQQITQIEA
ncbi:hypothetical protein ACHAXS_000966 [Conticribra weissflogii]